MKVMATIFSFGILLAGCASSSNVYEMQPGVFQVTATGDGYNTADRVTDLAMQKAQEHCSQRGKRVRVINEQQSITRMGFDTTLRVYFACT